MKRIAVKRFTVFLGIWLVLTAAALSALPFGVAAAVGATWMSLRLLPAGTRHARLVPVLRAVPGFLSRVAWGGIDVARRALDPRLPIAEGWIAYRTRLPHGAARVAFCSETSLLPGSLAAGNKGEIIYVHCLDRTQDVPSQLRIEEARIASIIGLEAEKASGH